MLEKCKRTREFEELLALRLDENQILNWIDRKCKKREENFKSLKAFQTFFISKIILSRIARIKVGRDREGATLLVNA